MIQQSLEFPLTFESAQQKNRPHTRITPDGLDGRSATRHSRNAPPLLCRRKHLNEPYCTTVHDMSKLTLWLWNLSQRQRQVDGVARRLQYGQDAPRVVIVLGRVGQADDDLVEPHAVRRGQAGGRAVQDSHTPPSLLLQRKTRPLARCCSYTAKYCARIWTCLSNWRGPRERNRTTSVGSMRSGRLLSVLAAPPVRQFSTWWQYEDSAGSPMMLWAGATGVEPACDIMVLSPGARPPLARP